MAAKNSIIPRITATMLRFYFAALLIGGLIWLRHEQLSQCLAVFDYRYVIPAMAAYGLHMIAVSWRWRKLAVMQGYRLSNAEAFSLTMQGFFFSLIIPGGAIGGDVAKMGLLSRRTPPGSRVEGIFTIFMDRVVGMLALFTLALLLMAATCRQFLTADIPVLSRFKAGNELLFYGLAALCIAGIGAGIAVFFLRQLSGVPGLKRCMAWIDRRFNSAASRMSAMAELYSGSPWTLTGLTLFSIFSVHLMTTLPLFFLLAGTGSCFTGHWLLIPAAVTAGNIAGLIPFSPGGIGLRDLTVIGLLAGNGINATHVESAQLLYTGIIVAMSLPGGIFFIFDNQQNSRSRS